MIRQFSNGATTHWAKAGDACDLADLLLIRPRNEDVDLVNILLRFDIAPFIDPFLVISEDAPIGEFWFEETPVFSLAEYVTMLSLDSTPMPPEIDIDWTQLTETPETIKSQIGWSHRAGDYLEPKTAAEIARFITPFGSAGLITSCQTEVTFDDNDVRWPRGDAAWFERILATGVGDLGLAWILKVEPLGSVVQNTTPNRIAHPATDDVWQSTIPGIVHPEMQPWDKMLFLWGHDHNVRWRCPAGTLVSLWIYRFDDTGAHGLYGFGGMLKGHTQIQRSPRTYENMTRFIK